MYFIFLIAAFSCIFTEGYADSSCEKLGGTCFDYRYSNSISGVATGKCSGDFYRRCLLPCGSCLTTESSYISQDQKCNSEKGVCKHDSNYCPNSYKSGKCGGPARRKCCPGAAAGTYSSITQVDTTGASAATASQDKLTLRGVRASHALAAADAGRMSLYKSTIQQAASDLGFEAAVIAGLISRESRANILLLDKDGYSIADGKGFGLMQVDKGSHTPAGKPTSLEHIKQGTQLLIGFIKGVQKEHPSWSKAKALKGGIAAYNFGVDDVLTYHNLDQGTENHDYANDITARAQYFKKNGY